MPRALSPNKALYLYCIDNDVIYSLLLVLSSFSCIFAYFAGLLACFVGIFGEVDHFPGSNVVYKAIRASQYAL